jgi:hydroxypyruvate isomerase
MGHAALPGAEAVFEAEIAQALDYASAIGAGRIHVLSGRADPASAQARDTLIANLKRAAPEAQRRGITLLIEPLNARDQPGYFLSHAEQGAEIVTAVGHSAVRLQFDCYHTQVQQGDMLHRLEGVLELVGHIQIAGPPARISPDQGELNYPWLLAEIDRLGYGGWIGLEYRCPEGTSAGLTWAAPYGIRAG